MLSLIYPLLSATSLFGHLTSADSRGVALAVTILAERPPEARKQAERAVAGYYANYAKVTPDPALAPDEANIVGVIEWAHAHHEDQLLAQLCYRMRIFWRDTGRTRVALQYLPWGLEAAERIAATTTDQADRKQAAYIRGYYGDILRHAGRLADAKRLYQRNLIDMRELGDRRGEGVTLGNMGRIERDRGYLDEAQRYVEESLAIAREVGDLNFEGAALNNLGAIAETQGRLDAAQVYYEESLAIVRKVGDRRGVGATLSNMAGFARDRGRLEEAQRNYEESLAILREVGNRRGEGTTLYRLAQIAEEGGALDRAEALHRESLDIGREIGHVQDTADSLRTLGRFLIERREQREEGCQMLQEAAGLYEHLGQADAAHGVRETLQRLGCEPLDDAE